MYLPRFAGGSLETYEKSGLARSLELHAVACTAFRRVLYLLHRHPLTSEVGLQKILTMFEIYKSPKNKQFYFRLKARNHQIILTSQAYKSKASCQNGVKSVQKNATSEQNFQLKQAKDGKFYFTLDAKNRDVIGSSQMYASKATRKKGLASVIANAPSASVKDLTT